MTGEEFLALYSDRENTVGSPRCFVVNRKEDISGVSGVGIVAWGAQFPNGKVALTWANALTSATWFDDISILEQIHGHGGSTEIIWIDDK